MRGEITPDGMLRLPNGREFRVARRNDALGDRLERNSIPEPNSGCILWTGSVQKDGHGRMKVDGRFTGPHRIAYVLKHGPIPTGHFVCHHCDVPSCINPAHLFLGTHDANMADMVAKGRSQRKRGEQNSRAVLTDEIVKAARLLHAQGTSIRAIARRFGVHKDTIGVMLRGLTWAHVA